MRPLELWGGHEYSVIRTQDRFTDQTLLQHHEDRPEDLELFANLGIKALRYPVLWERVAPKDPSQLDFTWTDERLRALKKIGVRPIVGLLHHGSGPKYTSLIDKDFARKFATYARAVAEQYPWVEDWNPINEPLTTARFSCLVGVWYPHAKTDEGKFWRALLNQVNAVRLGMKEIRQVNPRARLIQTDDLGFTHATPPMAEQAQFENERRWITWDLLDGKVVPGHPLWARIAGHGYHRLLEEIASDPVSADVIGANYYAASERLIDQRLDAYPGQEASDSPEPYANADAVRSIERPIIGLEGMLQMAWERYQRPVAVTETHNVGTRDEQMRWILETWRAAQVLRDDGIQIEAVTAWALLGSFDWKTLGAEHAMRYEVGIFDLGSGEPRATAIAPMLKALSEGREPPPNVALASPGWWRKDTRFDHDTEGRTIKRVEDLLPEPQHRLQSPAPVIACAPILVPGANGTLGRAIEHVCERRGLPAAMIERAELQLENRESIEDMIRQVRPCAILNAAGFASIERAESDRQRCFEANALGPENLAKAAKRAGIPLVTFSSDMVFDGTKDGPYVETDETRPLNAYGQSKAEGERRVAASGGQTLIIRSATFFSPHDAKNFAVRILDDLDKGATPPAANDCFMSPTFVPDLVDAALDLLIDGETGIWHLSNPACMSWEEFARELAEAAGFDPEAIVGMPARDLGWTAPRPSRTPLGSVRGKMLSEVEPAIARFLHDTRLAPHRRAPESSASQRDPRVFPEMV